jgi:hypothetical protein
MTSSAPGATVVVVVEVDVVEVVDVLVDVDAAVVAGVVVVVTSAVDVEVATSIDDDVDDNSVVCVLSLLQPVAISAAATSGKKRTDFTPEVWHAASRLPDQRVGLVATFNKL